MQCGILIGPWNRIRTLVERLVKFEFCTNVNFLLLTKYHNYVRY